MTCSEPLPRALSSIPERLRLKKPIIFCVDDERIVLESLKTELKTHFAGDYTIETASGALEALEAIKELVAEGYDIPVVITDYIMPVITGDVMLFHLQDEYPRMKKIMLTGQATMEAVTNAVNQAQLYRYIAKPWDPQDLIMTVSEAIKSYDQFKQLEDQNIVLKTLSDSLEIKVQERTAELSDLNVDLLEVQEEIKAKNAELEDYRLHLETLVADRTLELEQEIDERKKSEKRIRAALQEREVLLREVHHRTKNNMNVIISLLNLQANDIQDERLMKAFGVVSNRIHSMSAVHEQLYGQDQFDRIELSDYIQQLANRLISSLSSDPKLITLELDCAPAELDLERAIPFGLALNEVISNALIHGFKPKKSGTLSIGLKIDEKNILHLRVSNDGAPLKKSLDLKHLDSLGLHLVMLLVEDQLDGAVELKSDSKVHVHIQFPYST